MSNFLSQFKLATAEEYFRPKLDRLNRVAVHADYMEIAEDYADHVVHFEKMIDRGEYATLERMSHMSRKEYLTEALTLYPAAAYGIRNELAIIEQRESGKV